MASYESVTAGGNRWLIALCLLLIPFPLFLPYLWLDRSYFWGNVDSIFYLNIYTVYRDALFQGDIFPHWESAMNMHLGGLALYSLSPLAYSLSALISAPFGVSDEWQFMIGLYASQVFGAFAMWRWLRTHYEDWTAVAGALVYTLIPYKLMVLYIHFNLAQCWAMAFLPLMMLAAEHIQTRPGRLLYALSGALCFYAHPLTFISMGIVAGLYALYMAGWQWRNVLEPLVIAHALALCLVASYLAAMATALPWMQMQHWGSDYFSSLKNLHHIDDYFGLYAPAIAYIAWRYGKRYQAFGREHGTGFWIGCILILYVVATPLSYPLWKYVPAMNIFQFPFARLQPGMGVAAAVLAAIVLARRDREFSMPLAAILLMSWFAVEFRVELVYGHHPDIGVTPMMHKVARDHLITTSTMPKPVYFPNGSSLALKDFFDRSKEFEDMPRVRVTAGKASAKMIAEGRDWMTMHADVDSSIATFAVSQFYVPAWRGFSESAAIVPSSYPDGFIKLALPKGSYDIRLEITQTLTEKIADIVTLATLAFYACYYARRRRLL